MIPGSRIIQSMRTQIQAPTGPWRRLARRPTAKGTVCRAWALDKSLLAPLLPHKCGVPPGYGTPHLCGSEVLCRAPVGLDRIGNQRKAIRNRRANNPPGKITGLVQQSIALTLLRYAHLVKAMRSSLDNITRVRLNYCLASLFVFFQTPFP